MFLARCIHAMPVNHTPTFSSRDCDPPLLLLIALGSIFIAGEETAAKADALWRLANAAIATSWEGLLQRKGANDTCVGVQLVVTSYLRSMYAMLSGMRELRSIGQTSLGMGFTWARQAGIVSAASRPRTEILRAPNDKGESLDERWRTWVSQETQRRAVLGHYVLDGFLTDFTGQPTAVRHTADPMLLPSRDGLFEAKTAEQWSAEMQVNEEPEISFRDLYISLFDAESNFNELKLTYLSIRVVLEALQSLIYEHHEAGGCTIGTPSKQAISKAMVRLFSHQITTLSSTQQRVEHAIRWHVVSIRLAVETTALARQMCIQYNILQDLHTEEPGPASATELVAWSQTRHARRALLHAMALADLGLQVTLGRAHAVHLPMAIYTAAAIFAAMLASRFQLGLRPIITIPKVSDGGRVWAEPSVAGILDASDPIEAFLSGSEVSTSDYALRRNMADDLNGLHLVMEQLKPYWGVTAQMSNIIKQWLAIPPAAARPSDE